MARLLVALAFGLLVFQECSSRSLPVEEDSVVSIYTTQPNMASPKLDVYHQIANNIAEKITSPIFNFLGYGKNKTDKTTTKRPWSKVETLDEPDAATKINRSPVDNDISKEKDAEELSTEALRKVDKKPEKIVLYSSDSPNAKIEKFNSNDTINAISDDDETLSFDDVDDIDDMEVKPRDGSAVYFLELIGSFIQLVYGGIAALFSSSKGTN